MATHSRVLAWRIPGTGEPGGLPSMGSQELDTTERLHFHFSLSCIGEGMATHSSILAWAIPMDRGAYRATVSGIDAT